MPVVLASGKGRTIVVSSDRTTANITEAGKTVRVRDRASVASVTDTQHVLEVSSPGVQGPKGDPGLPGADAAAPTRPITNGENRTLLKGEPVCLLAGVARVATSDDAYHAVIGLVADDIPVGETGLVQPAGLITQLAPAWDAVQSYVGGLAPGAAYYLSADGRLSPVPPEITDSGWVVRIGTAMSSTDLFIDLEPGIKL